MIQKVLKVGSSAAVTIPKKALEELGLSIGDRIILSVNTPKQIVSIRRVQKTKTSSRQRKIASLALDFVGRYRADLEELAQK